MAEPASDTDVTDLTPNALVTDLAAALAHRGVAALQDPATLAAEAVEAASPVSVESSELETTAKEKLGELASQLNKQSQIPGLVTFTGFLGGAVEDSGGTIWHVLFVDWELSRWVVVPRDAIVNRAAMDDDTAPSGKRDVIWVKADASVGRGSGSQAIEARFLTGDFTRAGDIASGAGGGTAAAATGVFCEARSVGCCLFKTYRP